MPKTTLALIKEVYADGDRAYRDAVAAQVEGKDADDLWDRWQIDTAALLLASWATGAAKSLQAVKGKIPASEPFRFDRNVPEMLLRFREGAPREVIARFMGLLPITRSQWDVLIQNAFEAAGEMRQDEAANALGHILDRSPGLAAIVRPAAAGTPPAPVPGHPAQPLPEPVQVRRTPGVQGVARGAFFVTGMGAEQAKEVKSLLAKVIRGDAAVSVAGKKLEHLGVGDFVEQATLETGSDLTAARLETVYRTNLNRAVSQGQLDIVRNPTVQKFVPLMQFSATKDRRTRPTHRAMDGFVATVEQIDAQGINTPAGFNCRCGWMPVPISRAVSSGWCNEDGEPDYGAIKRHNGSKQRLVDTGQFPDPGFVSG